jgi:hypothetical protein
VHLIAERHAVRERLSANPIDDAEKIQLRSVQIRLRLRQLNALIGEPLFMDR